MNILFASLLVFAFCLSVGKQNGSFSCASTVLQILRRGRLRVREILKSKYMKYSGVSQRHFGEKSDRPCRHSRLLRGFSRAKRPQWRKEVVKCFKFYHFFWSILFLENTRKKKALSLISSSNRSPVNIQKSYYNTCFFLNRLHSMPTIP